MPNTQYEFLKKEFLDELGRVRSIDSYGYMTQKEMAGHTGISQTTVHRIFQGNREITVSEFLQLCDLIDRPPVDFFNRNRKKDQS